MFFNILLYRYAVHVYLITQFLVIMVYMLNILYLAEFTCNMVILVLRILLSQNIIHVCRICMQESIDLERGRLSLQQIKKQSDRLDDTQFYQVFCRHQYIPPLISQQIMRHRKVLCLPLVQKSNLIKIIIILVYILTYCL